MSFLFDSSAILNVVRRRKASLLKGYTIDLAFYEILNAVWKETKLLNRISMDTAMLLLKGAVTAWKVLPKVEVDYEEVFRIAVELDLTAYDSSYLVAARKLGLTLVTDDQKLLKVSGISSRQYLEEVMRSSL